MTQNDRSLQILFDELVPPIGKCESLAGELIRAVGRIGYRWSNDGDHVGIGYGKETCNMAARFLIAHGNRKIRTLTTTLWGLSGEAVYGSVFDQLVGAVVEFVNLNPELRTMPTVDMFDYFDEEADVDDE